MKVLRVHIRSWTASYRIPFLMIGEQATLNVPPLSTAYGIISTASGRFVTPQETGVGIIGISEARVTDLEKIYQVGKSRLIEKTNVLKRQFLYDNSVFLYISNLNLAEYFEHPVYPILLGRSSDLAMVKEVTPVELYETDEAEFQHTLLPFEEPFKGQVASPIMPLPICFTETIPRRPTAVKIFYLIDRKAKIRAKRLLFDQEKGWGVWLHKQTS